MSVEEYMKMKNVILLFLLVTGALVLPLPGTGWCTLSTRVSMATKKAVLIIAERDFRDEELFQPKAVLERSGVKVDIASTTTGKARGKLGATVVPDKLVSDINIADYDVIAFIGGPGSAQYWDDPAAHKLVQEAVASGKIVAAICAAPVTLANAGVLADKNATCFPSESQALRDNGANYTARPVEVDGNIITADGPSSARAFGEALVKRLGER
jgi:protease I